MPNSVSRRVLLLGAGLLHQRHYQRAKSLGYKVIAMDARRDAPAIRFADDYVEGNPSSTSDVIRAAGATGADAIVTLGEFGVIAASEASDAMGMRATSPESARATRDKSHARAIWANASIDQPRFESADRLEDAAEIAVAFGLPVMVKAPNLSAAQGVARITRIDQLAPALESIRLRSSQPVLIEEAVSGVELSVEGIAIGDEVKVLACGDKELWPHESYCVTRSINYPGKLLPEQIDAVDSVARACVAALGITNSPFHLELVQTEDRLIPLECAARGGGGHIFSDIVELVSGVDLLKATIETLLGDSPVLSVSGPRGACYRFLSCPEGLFQSVEGIERARQDRDVVDVVLLASEGEHHGTPTSGLNRAGCLVTRGETREAACNAADRIESTLAWRVSR